MEGKVGHDGCREGSQGLRAHKVGMEWQCYRSLARLHLLGLLAIYLSLYPETSLSVRISLYPSGYLSIRPDIPLSVLMKPEPLFPSWVALEAWLSAPPKCGYGCGCCAPPYAQLASKLSEVG